jgi:hypothetical protein
MNAELDVRMHDCIDQGDAGERYRRALTAAWQLDLQAPLRGEVIFVRRTSERGTVHLLGRIFAVDPLCASGWSGAKSILPASTSVANALRRRQPDQQPPRRDSLRAAASSLL